MISFETLNEGITKEEPLQNIKKRVNTAGRKLIDKTNSRETIRQAIESSLKFYKVEVVVDQDPNVDSGDKNLNAFYDWKAEKNKEIPFEIILVFSPEDKIIHISKVGWEAMNDKISDAI